MGLHDPADPTFRDAFATVWIAEDGSKVAEIHIDGERRLTVSLGAALGRTDIGVRLVANWRPRRPGEEASRVAPARLDRLVVEAGTPGFDRTYQLMFARPNTDERQFGGLMWVPLALDTPVADVRLFPETGASYLDALVYMEDEGYIPWAEPLSTYRPATAEEIAAHRAAG